MPDKDKVVEMDEGLGIATGLELQELLAEKRVCHLLSLNLRLFSFCIGLESLFVTVLHHRERSFLIWMLLVALSERR